MNGRPAGPPEHAFRHHQVIAEMLEADLSPGDVFRLKIVSNSMRPLMSSGDQIVAEIVDPDKIRRGDIVVIRRANDYLTHRVIGRSRGRWVTKGDNNTLPDTATPTDKLIGRVITINAEGQIRSLNTRKWRTINPALGRLSALETRNFRRHPALRRPFRWAIKFIQKVLL